MIFWTFLRSFNSNNFSDFCLCLVFIQFDHLFHFSCNVALCVCKLSTTILLLTFICGWRYYYAIQNKAAVVFNLCCYMSDCIVSYVIKESNRYGVWLWRHNPVKEICSACCACNEKESYLLSTFLNTFFTDLFSFINFHYTSQTHIFKSIKSNNKMIKFSVTSHRLNN